jgi:arginine-tRNA-protein transferase
VESHVVEYREPGENGRAGKLIGACLTDRQGDGLSMIYSFFDTELEHRKGLGNFIIMDHILRAAKAGLPYVYLGYWVEGSRRMQYKIRYRPLEKLSRSGWIRFDPQEQAQALRGVAPRDEPPLPIELAGIFRK